MLHLRKYRAAKVNWLRVDLGKCSEEKEERFIRSFDSMFGKVCETSKQMYVN